MHKRILVAGRAGVGKDSLADYLVEKYGFKKIAFADPIYKIAREYFGMKIKNRWLLQQIGQKFREIEPSVWVNYAFKEAEKYDKVVISDCRQANEYQIGIKKGFLPIRVNADLNIRIKRLEKRDGKYPDLSLLENESETGADGYKYIEVDNNGRFKDLYQQIDEIMNREYDGYLEALRKELQLKQMYG